LRQRWALDFVLMENLYSIAISTDDHEISFYGNLIFLKSDASTLEKFLILNLRDHNALSMDFWMDPDNLDLDKSRLVYGTETGHVCVYDFPNRLIADRGPRKKDTVTDISIDSICSKSSIHYGTLQKRKAHSDWVTMVRYYHNMKCVVSSSIDPIDSLVITTEDINGRLSSSSISVPKGVNCFAYSSSPVALVTGGRDYQLRIFNPRILQAQCTSLVGHSAPITDIKVNNNSFQIISLSIDKEIKVWGLRNHQCLQTITDCAFHKPDNFISCIKFSEETGGALIAASSMIRRYKIKGKTSFQAETKSHDFPVRNLLYCKEFNLVVSGCNGGLVHVWV
jgi:WD40 repeat protein